MHVFVTGATGWVGSAVVAELIAHGHAVTGLTRSAEKAAALAASGATVLSGTLADHDILRDAAAAADAVIHTAFNHDFSKFADNAAQDVRAIETLGQALEGSDRPLLVTSGLPAVADDATAFETDIPGPIGPRRSEQTARSLAERGIHAATVRLPPSVHGIGDYGFVPMLINIARQTGVSAYIGDGQNKWSSVHRLDAAKVYRLALETGVRQAAYHPVDDAGVTLKEIATLIGQHLGLPVESRTREHFTWFADFAGHNRAASSALTREWLNWTPTETSLLSDLDNPAYYAA